ncbi:halocyanin [Halorubellus sp. JP-L1]|uniref:cupredoxin domain-containing protein n=1 Tax=Halorubellus sp. JP-L1 TaxID=2715753 RepID=UPI001408A8E6|nr:plastocyanin/azurin family copper-binding protein [Halorubellus sp. JP-L1]NHN40113.1 halocyanin [Halorubellus sp. JP-L1]
MNRRSVLASGALATAGAVSGCLAMFNSAGGDADDYDVGMTDSAFDPETVTVAVGDTVVWKNTSGRSHTVTAYDSGLPDGADYFASGGFEDEQAARDAWKRGAGGIVSGDTYEHAFDVAGEYEYVCIPHERQAMTGTIVVEE